MSWNPYQAPAASTPEPVLPPRLGVLGTMLAAVLAIGAALVLLSFLSLAFINRQYFATMRPATMVAVMGMLLGCSLALAGALLMWRFPAQSMRWLLGAVAVLVLTSLAMPRPGYGLAFWGPTLLAVLHTYWRVRKHPRGIHRSVPDMDGPKATLLERE